MQIAEFFKQLGHPHEEMEIDVPIDVSDKRYQILSFNNETKERVWSNVTKIVRKSPDDAYKLMFDDRNSVTVTAQHRFWVKESNENESWMSAIDASIQKNLSFLTENGWKLGNVVKCDHEIDVLDIEVEKTNSYFSNGVLSHNTMYGDPTVTPGGSAVPFHASVRVALTGGTKVGEKDEGMIGINVIARTVKNKVAPPFRKVEFQIHFGVGIVEHEEMFDLIRTYCEEKGPLHKDGKIIRLEGTGGWKTFTVADGSTGEVILEKKFNKSNFDQLINDAKIGPYIEDLLEYTMVKKPEQNEKETITPDEEVEG